MTATSVLQPRLLIVAFCLAASPAALLGQIELDPAAPQSTQPAQQQQQQPGARRAVRDPQQDSSPTPGMTGQEMKDKMFLRKAAEGGIAEVKLGQLAAEKGASDEVRTFGAKMVADHTQLNNQMKPIADSMGVRLPKDMNKMDQAEYDKLSALSGPDFDQEYLTDMVKDHRKDLREFHMESMATNDPTLKAAVDKGEAVIREHTRMVTRIARDKGVALPPGGLPNGQAAPGMPQPPTP